MVDQSETLTDDPELEDLDERPELDLTRIELALLRNPVVVRALAAIVVATLVLLWPERTDRILARLVGVALAFVGSTSMWAALRSRPRNWSAVLAGLVGTAIGIFLVATPTDSEDALARLVGAVVLVAALRDLVTIRETSDRESRAWVLSRSAALLGTAALLLLFPGEVFAAMTTLVALGWIALSFVVIVVSLDARTTGTTDHAEASRVIATWLANRPKSVESRQALYDKILFEGPLATKRLIRFVALMVFASVISSMGVVTDSTAVVIGAMLIAPLMTPLMAMAISLVMGWPHRLARSTAVALVGIVVAIAIGVFLGLTVPAVIDTAANGQITGRSSPTMLDLITAIAAGAAGAYGLSRPDVSDSLPGVAIAISLVPPLSVVGIAYSQGDWVSGNGALLLFMTNMLAILVMGGLTFIATGVTPVRHVAENQHRVRTYLATVAALGALVVGSLLLNGAQIAENLVEQSSVESTIDDWLAEYGDHSLVRVVLDDETVVATIVGPTTGAPTARSLVSALESELERSTTVDLRLIVEERDLASSAE